MDSAAKAMAAVGQANDPKAIQKIMQEFSKENMKMDMTSEMMEDALDSAFDTEDADDEADDVMNEVGLVEAVFTSLTPSIVLIAHHLQVFCSSQQQVFAAAAAEQVNSK